eukprot:gene7879-38055_t
MSRSLTTQFGAGDCQSAAEARRAGKCPLCSLLWGRGGSHQPEGS